jgi:hypothetical protein
MAIEAIEKKRAKLKAEILLAQENLERNLQDIDPMDYMPSPKFIGKSVRSSLLSLPNMHGIEKKLTHKLHSSKASILDMIANFLQSLLK